MRPLRIFLFFVAVFGILLVLSMVFPEEGISLGEEARLRFASSKNLFAKDSSNSHYTDSLIRHATVTGDPEFGQVENIFVTRGSVSAKSMSGNQGTFSAEKTGSASSDTTTGSTARSIAESIRSITGSTESLSDESAPISGQTSADSNQASAESEKISLDSNEYQAATSPAGSVVRTIRSISGSNQSNSDQSRLAGNPAPSSATSSGGTRRITAKDKIRLDSIIKARIDSVSNRIHPIEIPPDMEPELHTFFEEAERSQTEGRLLRILHYGDSQIENDRMTALLRNRLQQVFGGSGCGMVPAIPLYHGNPTFRQKYGGEWLRYTGFGRRDKTIQHSSYGMMACFTAVPIPEADALPYLEFNFLSGRRASAFSNMTIYLHSYVEGGMIRVHYNDTITDTIAPLTDGYQELVQQLDFEAKKVRLEFDLQQGGRVYGISFDPDAGIQMDNIAMRGSSGLEFSRSDPVVLDTMLEAVDPGLIIMQFGGNVVPYISNYDYYRRRFTRELNYLRSLSPESAVLVIGPGDMSTKENGRFVTYNALEPVRDALRDAAHETGCAFWDMYTAMGGKNSIQNFVLANPPLASPDYIHFTPKGANLMAGMFFDAIMLEYGKYKAEKQLAVHPDEEEAIRETLRMGDAVSGRDGTELK